MRLAVLVTAAILLTGCDANEAGPTQEAPSVQLVFPTQPEQHVVEQSGIAGTLVRRGDCLYVASSGSRFLPIWPPGFSYIVDNDDIFVVDENGHRLARVGYRIVMGGGYHGESRSDPLSPPLRDETEGCLGPYFLVGDVIEPGS